MVLAELGGKLRDSLRKLQSASTQGVTEKEVDALLSDVARALIESDVNVKLVMQLRASIKGKVEDLLDDDDEKQPNVRAQRDLAKTIQRAVVDELVALLSPTYAQKAYTMRKGKPNVVLFVGLQGAGKTTSIAKFAHYYQRRGWKTAMVCADTFRAGAFDQLKQNATKLRVPFYGSYTEADPVVIAEDGVRQFVKDRYEVIIVDTSGRHKQESALFDEMQEISAAVRPDNTVLVMDATQGQAVYDQALAFHSAVDVGAVIVTKLDGHAKGGGALSAVAATSSPILFLGSGEHFDDLDPFNAQSFVSKLLGFGDVRGLMDAMKSVTDSKTQEQLMERMSKGEFTLRMMYQQFEKVMSMGPLNKLVGMMPGMPDYLVPKGGDQQATDRLRKFMIMMDSMNNAELDGKIDMHVKDDPQIESRIRRIAAGSGSHPNEVKMLLLAHKQFEGMVSKMGKSGLMGKGAQQRQAQLQAQMRKNPNFINQRLNQMDPRMLQQMGGRESVMAMMQQMAKGGGAGGGVMPNMEALMGGGVEGMPGMMPPGGGMPGMGGGNAGGMDMTSIMKMAQAMGMGGAPPASSGR
jgi:signal recognition particle subunit SRP54